MDEWQRARQPSDGRCALRWSNEAVRLQCMLISSSLPLRPRCEQLVQLYTLINTTSPILARITHPDLNPPAPGYHSLSLAAFPLSVHRHHPPQPPPSHPRSPAPSPSPPTPYPDPSRSSSP